MRLRRLFAMVGATTTAIVISIGAVPASAGADTPPLTLSTTPHTGTAMTGASVTDSASLEGQNAGPASGQVTYSLFHGTCGAVGTPVSSDTETLDGSGTVPDSKSFGPLGADDYVFLVTYSGDTTYPPIDTSNPDCEPFTIAPVTLTLATTPNTGTGSTGASVSDTASLSGQTSIPASGFVTYTLDNGTCASPGTQVGNDTDTEYLDSSGTVPPSVAFGPLGAGSYVLEVIYSGDTNYSPITTAKCDAFAITPGGLTLVTMPMTGTAMAGVSVTDNASLNGQAPGVAATGTVTYTLDNGTCDAHGTQIGTDTESVSAGVPNSSNSYGPLAAGSYIFLVTYSGDANYSTTSTAADCEPFTLAPFAPGVTTTVTDVQSGTAWVNGGPTEVVGQSAFDSASITGTTGAEPPTGTVTYRFYSGSCATGTQVGADDVENLTAGVPAHSTTTAALAAGTYSYSATYSGDTNYSGPVTGPCESFTVAAVALNLATTPHTGTGSTGASVSDSATLGGQVSGFTATGSVTYKLFTGTCTSAQTLVGTDSDTETLDGTGHVPDSTPFGPLGAGNYVFEVTYSGDSNYTAITTAHCEQFSLTKLAPTLTTSPNTGTATAGGSVTDSAVLNGQASGIPASGTVVYTLDHGTCAAHGTQVGTDTENVTAGVPHDSTSFGPLGAGSYIFLVTYGGDTNYSAITAADCEPFSLAKVALTLATTPHTGTGSTGASVSDSATLGGQSSIPASGTVNYTLDHGTCASPGTQVGTNTETLDGTGHVPDSTPFGPLGAGSYIFEVAYGGDTNYTASTTADCEAFSLTKLAPTLATTPDNGSNTPGASVFDTAVLNGQAQGVAATGTVVYTLDNGTCASPGTQVGTDSESVSAGVPISSNSYGPLAAGSYVFLVTYSGDTNYTASTTADCEPFRLAQFAPGVTTAVTDVQSGTAWVNGGPTEVVGQSAFDSATITNTTGAEQPTGTVTYRFYSGSCATGTQVGADDVENLTAGVPAHSTTTAALAAGTYSYSASYSGDTNYSGPVTGPCESFTVAPVAPNLATTPHTGTGTTGASVSDSATLGGQSSVPASGTVTYTLDHGTCASPGSQVGTDTETLDGTGHVPDSTPIGPLGAGSYVFEATYGGDTNYSGPVTGPCESVTVAPVALNLATTPHTGTGATGASVSDSATLGGQVSGFAATGSVTYKVFAGTCASPGTQMGGNDTVTIDGSGNVPPSAGFGPLTTGSYLFLDFFSPGDANYTPAQPNTCEPFVIGRAAPTSPVITDLPNSAVAGGAFTASVSTNGDGVRSVASQSPAVCTVGGDGLTVSYVAAGNCTLTAQVGGGTNYIGAAGGPQIFGISPQPRGYWLVGTDGGIFSFGAAAFHGSMGGIPLQRPVVGITPTPSRHGYWLVASDGGIFSFGDSNFYGSIPGVGLHPAGSGLPNSLNAPIVGMVPSSTGNGYFMIASDGGVFAFGDARFAGSCPGIGGCAGTAVAVMPDHSGNGYWLVTAAGAVYAFGDAPFFGSPPPTGAQAVSAVAAPDGNGYWIVDNNGAVWAFGDANAMGAPVGYVNVFNPATAIFPTSDGHGYWVAAARGDVFSYGDAPYLGSMAARGLNGQIIAGFGF